MRRDRREWLRSEGQSLGPVGDSDPRSAPGGSYLSPRLLTRLVDGFREQGNHAVRQPRFGTLTKREREILKMLAEGRSVKEIATGFDLSVKTVEAHKFNLMRKLDIHNKAQLVQY